MASVSRRGGKWYLKYQDNRGRWMRKVSTAETKTEAKRLAQEVDRQQERQRLRLEPLPPDDGGGTLADLLQWWLKTYSQHSPSHERNICSVAKHFLRAPIAELRLMDVTPGVIETFLQDKAETHSPQTLNHLRRFLLTAFNRARRAGRYTGSNPVQEVARRKVPKRKPDFLRVEEMPLVLEALFARWRPLFATAIYTGLRKGELLGLRKSDVDLAAGLIMVGRSYDRATNKGLREEAVPIAAELLPFLRFAIQSSPSDLVFPRPDGSMMREDVDVENVLRRALGRAGIVTAYHHVCRKKDCHHLEVASDASERRCPVHGMRLWPKAQVRPIRFHDLRHTTASLLLMSGASLAAVQRILRHSDPRITTEVYGHLLPGYLRAEIDRLAFGVKGPDCGSQDSQPVAGSARPFGPPVVQEPKEAASDAPMRSKKTNDSDEVGCGRGGTRTHYPRLRRPILYPDELRALTDGALDYRGGKARASLPRCAVAALAWVDLRREPFMPATRLSARRRWRHPDRPQGVARCRGNFRTVHDLRAARASRSRLGAGIAGRGRRAERSAAQGAQDCRRLCLLAVAVDRL